MKLEHVGIAVHEAKSARRLMEALIGETPYKSESVESEGVRTHFIRAGAAKLELLEALDDDSPLARHVEKRGQGLHHLAFEVDDLEATQDRLTKAGFTVLGPPRAGADGKRIFFVHPRDTGGVLYEFCRQSRSILAETGASVAGRNLTIRRAGTNGPACLVVGAIPIDVEMLARQLEQSARIIVVEELSHVARVLDALELDTAHLVAASSTFFNASGLDARIRSMIVLVDGDAGELFRADRPMLVAARPSGAAAAVALYERSDECDIAIGSGDLLARTIETHILDLDGR